MTQKIHETTVHPYSLGKDLQAEDTVCGGTTLELL